MTSHVWVVFYAWCCLALLLLLLRGQPLPARHAHWNACTFGGLEGSVVAAHYKVTARRTGSGTERACGACDFFGLAGSPLSTLRWASINVLVVSAGEILCAERTGKR